MNPCEDSAKALFDRLMELESPEERVRLLDAECGPDLELRSEIEGLLLAYELAGSFLEHPALGGVPTEIFAGTNTDPNAENCKTFLEKPEIPLGLLSPSETEGAQGRLGQYEILESVGRGGMGIVLKGHDTKLNRIVAVKILAPELASNATARTRFSKEAQAAAAVSHDHVVTIHAVEEYGHQGEKDLPYLVMEYVDGLSLQEKIDRDGPLELKEILRIGYQVAAGLAAAHLQGLIHRDVKPSNILLQNGVQRVKITDFGLARAVDDVGITRTGEVTGTPQYMSPEQAQGHAVDPRSDLFSLGSVLYAMCTGRSPFRANSAVAALRRVCDDAPRPIREINPDLPHWLTGIIDQLLEKDPADRIQTAAEVAELFGKHLAHLQDPGTTPYSGTIQPAKRRLVSRAASVAGFSRRWFIAGGVLLLLAATLGVTEGTGVTQFSATVIRLAAGEGTLVIEVDDPTVKVSLDGEELSISGAGLQEIKVRPGPHQFEAFDKNGKPVKHELVTITRGDREVVRVTREPTRQSDVHPADRQPSPSDIFHSDQWLWTAPVNLGSTVNSENGEESPFVSDDELTLIFSSDRAGGLGHADLWQSTRPSVGTSWSAPVNLGSNVNSESNDTYPFLSADGLTLFVTSDRQGGQGFWDIWMHRRESKNAEWPAAINLGPPINGPAGDGAMCLTADGLVMLFHSHRPGGEGSNDLWMSRRVSPTAEWSEPVPLGPPVNTEHQEYRPRLTSDGRTLLFVSDRPGGEGGLDLWMSRGASAFGPWSKPINLRAPINSGGHETSCCLSLDERSLYFASGRSGNVGAHDLWMARRVPRIDHVQKAIELAQQGSRDEAAQEFNRALDLVPEGKDTDAARMAIIEHMLPLDELFHRVVALRPRDIDLWRLRAIFFARNAQWVEAADCFAKRLEMGRAGAGVWHMYAMALLAKNDVAKYREICAQILETFSKEPNPIEQQRASLALAAIPEAVDEPQDAFALAQRMFSRAPEKLWCRQTYAMWLYRTDRLKEAISIIEQMPSTALEPGVGQADILYFATMAYSRLGDMERARKWVDRAAKHTARRENQANTNAWYDTVFAKLLNDEMYQVLAREQKRADKPTAKEPASVTNPEDDTKSSRKSEPSEHADQ